jgi:hypothetical protein
MPALAVVVRPRLSGCAGSVPGPDLGRDRTKRDGRGVDRLDSADAVRTASKHRAVADVLAHHPLMNDSTSWSRSRSISLAVISPWQNRS